MPVDKGRANSSY